MNREKMLNDIMAQDFIVSDLQLYMDTHPADNEALKAYNEAALRAKKLHDDYEKLHGPLTSRHPTAGETYDWMTENWPWQNNYIR